MKIRSLILPLIVCLSACSEVKWDIGQNYEPQIIVEGWIEEGQIARVMLSQMIPYTDDTQAGAVDMNDIPIIWATVSISDGETSEMMIGTRDNDYTPPFMYVSSAIRGEVGKEYTINISYSGRKLTATTSIPEPVPIEQVEVTKSPDCDTLYSIRIYFKDDPSETNYYKVFTRVKNTDTRYYSAFMGDFSDEVLSEEAWITVNRAFRHTRYYEHTPYFYETDTVDVKFTQLSKAGFEFWSSYENEVTNGSNILFPNTSSLKSNIDGGLGIWCGYGQSIERVIIRDYAK